MCWLYLVRDRVYADDGLLESPEKRIDGWREWLSGDVVYCLRGGQVHHEFNVTDDTTGKAYSSPRIHRTSSSRTLKKRADMRHHRSASPSAPGLPAAPSSPVPS